MTIPKARTSHYIGIDPSVRGTGIAILSITGTKVERQTMKIALKENGAALLYLQCNTFLNFIGARKEGVIGVCLEGPSLHSVTRADAMGQVRGAYNLCCMQTFWPNALPREIPPTSLKKFFSGRGTASKEDMVSAATLRGWNVGSDDEADAAGLAELARALHDTSISLTRKQLEALKGIESMGQSPGLALAKNKTLNV